MSAPWHVLVPEGVDDPARPSGGNVYDQHLCAGLAAAGVDVRTRAVADAAAALCNVPDGASVVVDGLLATPGLVPHAGRLRLAVLLHMPTWTPDERAVLAAAAVVITTSDWARGRVLAEYGLDPRAVHTARPGTEPAPLADGTPGGGRLLCVGVLAPHKAQDVLVDALAGLRGEWSCDLVGSVDRDHAFAARLRQRIDAHGLAGRVRLAGPQVGAALAAAYAAADVLVLPSRAESYGMVLGEALARGLPAIASAVGGVPEALGTAADGRVPGLLVPPGDEVQLAAALARWLGDASLRAGLRAAARSRRGSLPSWEETVQIVRAAVNVSAGVSRRSL
jgi:glycosyltransferase involved in cell wall biosynthesis